MASATELIENYRREIRDKDISRERAAEILTRLSALYGNVTEEIRQREMTYNKKYAELLNQEEKVAKAEALSKTTEEYFSFKQARDVEKVLIELIRSLKYFLRVKENEWEGTI